jgi:hypothetical protein
MINRTVSRNYTTIAAAQNLADIQKKTPLFNESCPPLYDAISTRFVIGCKGEKKHKLK